MKWRALPLRGSCLGLAAAICLAVAPSSASASDAEERSGSSDSASEDPGPDEAPARASIETERTSTPLMIAGIAGVVAGSLTLGAGQFMRGDPEQNTAGLVMLATGTVLIGVGVPLWVYGAQDAAVAKVGGRRAVVRGLTARRATLAVGAAAAELRFTF